MPGRDDRALRAGERDRTQIDGRHRLVEVDEVEALLGERLAAP